jgi:ABC-type lipoprotein release transport system permease subunit
MRHWAGTTLRRQARDLVAVVLLLGLLGGISLAALAGARRTQSAYGRFLRSSETSTMAVNPGQYDPEVDALLADFPNVERSATYVAFQTGPLVDGQPDFNQDFETLGSPDGRFFTMDRFSPTKGRLPDPGRVAEVAMNEVAAERYGYAVGQTLDLGTYSTDQVSSDTFFEDPPPPVIETHATIVGIGLFVDEVLQDDTNQSPLMLVTPAFTAEAAAYATYAWQGLVLAHGDADVPAFKERYAALADPGAPMFFRVTSVDTFHALQAVRPLAIALAAFGAIVGLAALILVGQSIGRWVRRGRADQAMLRAMGAGPRALMGTSLALPVVALLLGALAAVGVAFGASPSMPIGPMRRVEVDPGLDADWAVLGTGVAVILFLLLLAAWVTGQRQLPHRRAARHRARPIRTLGAAGAVGMSPAAVNGLRMAFDPGEGLAAVPMRSVIMAGGIAVSLVVATLTFGASFTHLLDTPALYGWDWDVAVFDRSGYGNLDIDTAHALLDEDPAVAGWSGAYFGADSINGADVALLGMAVGSAVTPPIVTGRMLQADDEIVLGSATARSMGVHLGDAVTVGVGDDLATLRVVGTATLPTIGILHGAHTSLGVGALVVPARVPGYDRQAEGEGAVGAPQGEAGPPVIFIRNAPGHLAPRVATSDLAEQLGPYPGSATVLGAQRSAEIVSSRQAGGAPAGLAIALAVAAAVSLAAALSASVRRRRPELALLRAVGFTPRQLATCVAWQATATAATGVLVGMPAGVVLGRVLWTAFAGQLDVVAEPVVPLGLIALVSALTILVANLAALTPARRAQRIGRALVAPG